MLQRFGICLVGIASIGFTFAHPALSQPAAGPAGGRGFSLNCPLRVSTESVRLTEPGSGGDFRVSIQGVTLAFLVDIELHSGAVGAASALAATRMTGRRREWTLPPGQSGLLAVCRYEGGIALTRPIPATAKACTATTLPRSHGEGGWWYVGGASLSCS